MSAQPRPEHDFAHIPALELGRRVRVGEVRAADLFEAFAERLETQNPALNALVADRLELARAEVAAIDAAIARGEDPGPLAGVPFTTKEMASAAGLPVTAGSAARRGAIADRDATFVRRAREAGAVLVGVSNQSELGLWWESTNPVYGRTRNPYDLNRTPGGSSGGEGALVSAGLNGFGIGSDMGGSIRLPSFFCGVFGHKPTSNFVPTSGHFPLDYSEHRLATPPSTRYVAIGPMSRHATDLLPLLRTVAGACPDDPDAVDPQLGEVEDPAGKRVYFLEDPGIRFASATRREQRDAVLRAVRALRDRGADVRPWDGPSLRHGLQIFTGMLAELDEGVGLETLLSGAGGMPLLRELPRVARGTSQHAGHALMLVFGERFVRPSPRAIMRLSRAGRQLRDEIDAHLGDDGVLVLPTFPRSAPRHGGTLLRPFDVAYTGLFNVTEHPVTAAPTGLVDGLPTGVQIVGGRGMDHLPISMAVAMEAAGLRWVPPWGRG